MVLDERKAKVLRAIIEDYICSAEPVGSRTVAKKYHLNVSPATIRNEMADLEEMGYLEQPHTSAGRIPSDRGYRFYVDFLLEDEDTFRDKLSALIRKAYLNRTRELHGIVALTVNLLSELTDYVALVLGPQVNKATIRGIRLIKMSPGKGLLAVLTDVGFLESRVVDLPLEITDEELLHISDTFSRELSGLSFDKLNSGFLRLLRDELWGYQALMEAVLETLDERLRSDEDERVYVGGTARIMNQPEFRDVSKLKGLLESLEQNKILHDLLASGVPGNNVFVAIGRELNHKEVQDCSVVSSPYEVRSLAGRIGVLGPKRMDYRKTIRIVEETTLVLNDVLEGLFKA